MIKNIKINNKSEIPMFVRAVFHAVVNHIHRKIMESHLASGFRKEKEK